MAKQSSQKTEKETIGDPLITTGQKIVEPGTALPPEDSRIKVEGLAQQNSGTIFMVVAAGVAVVKLISDIFFKKDKE